MGLKINCIATIKAIESKGNYTKAKLSINNKSGNQFYCSFNAFVSLVGEAHKKAPQVGDKIKVTSFDVNNGYLDKSNGTQKWTNSIQVTVFDFEFEGERKPAPSISLGDFVEIAPPDDDSLPF